MSTFLKQHTESLFVVHLILGNHFYTYIIYIQTKKILTLSRHNWPSIIHSGTKLQRWKVIFKKNLEIRKYIMKVSRIRYILNLIFWSHRVPLIYYNQSWLPLLSHRTIGVHFYDGFLFFPLISSSEYAIYWTCSYLCLVTINGTKCDCA